MISLIAHGEAKNDEDYIEEYHRGKDHTGERNRILIRYPTEFEPDCNYVIEYQELPLRYSVAKTDCNDIHKVELQSSIYNESNYVIRDFDTKNHFFNHTDFRLIQIFVAEKIPHITELFTHNDELFISEERDGSTHEKDYYYQRPTGEKLQHMNRNEHLIELSRIVRYNDLYKSE